jgi:hypothetical protein
MIERLILQNSCAFLYVAKFTRHLETEFQYCHLHICFAILQFVQDVRLAPVPLLYNASYVPKLLRLPPRQIPIAKYLEVELNNIAF